MGLFDFLKRNNKKTRSADTEIFEELKSFNKKKPESRVSNKAPEKPPVKPVYNEELRKQEVSGIKDDDQLIEIISGKGDSDAVKRIAIANLSDQSRLVGIVERTRVLNRFSDASLRKLIIDNVTDQRTLYDMAVGEKYTKTRDEILTRIKDKALIKSMILSEAVQNIDIIEDFLKKIKNPNELLEIFQTSKSENIRKAALNEIKDEKILREIIMKNPLRYTYMVYRLKKEGKTELVRILEDIQNKNAELKKIGGYICEACSGENSPEDGPVSCTCKHCGAENHDWKHVSDVTEYRDYAVGCTYDECKRCGARKNYKNVDYGYLE